jgi:hypothetical protein
MYKITGSDGNEYGPVGLQQLQQWIAQGRVNAQTRVQGPGATDWKMASEFPELGSALGSTGIPPSPPSAVLPSQTAGQANGMAIASFILGLASVVLCLGVLTGIPAIICGHIAHSRSGRLPAPDGGAGVAIAGLVMGYAGVIVTVLVVVMVIPGAMLLPALSRAKERAQRINCANNLRQVGLGFKIWAGDHQDGFPFNVSTNQGGTLELCSLGSDGFDMNAMLHFQVLSNELSTPRILVCPGDASRQPAVNFQNLQSANVSYQLHSGLNETNAEAVLAVCPIHGNVLLCDGSVHQRPGGRR